MQSCECDTLLSNITTYTVTKDKVIWQKATSLSGTYGTARNTLSYSLSQSWSWRVHLDPSFWGKGEEPEGERW